MPTTDPDFRDTAAMSSDGREGRDIDRVVAQAYDELRALAHDALAGDSRSPTLSPTALIHEAYVRLAGSEKVAARGRAYFFAAAARAMRQILVDHARRKNRLKRGGGVVAVTLDLSLVAGRGPEMEILDLDRALTEFSAVAPRAAAVVECRFFGGMSVDETAAALDVTARTVKRDWAFARAWLHDRLEGSEGGGSVERFES